MVAIKLDIPGPPVPQPRPRFGKTWGGKPIAREADAGHPIHAYKDAIRLIASSEMAGREPIQGPVSLKVIFFMPRPQRYKANSCLPHIKRPDTDNLIKGVKDAMSGIVYVDDSQVWDESIRKVTVFGDMQPRTDIEIIQGGFEELD